MKKLLFAFVVFPIIGLSHKNKFPESGNVSIGTISPVQKLHVYNGSSGGVGHPFSDSTIEDNEQGRITILTLNTISAYYGFAEQEQEDELMFGMHENGNFY